MARGHHKLDVYLYYSESGEVHEYIYNMGWCVNIRDEGRDAAFICIALLDLYR